jgi:hypothetical protein
MSNWLLLSVGAWAVGLVVAGAYAAHSLMFHGFKPLWRFVLNT